MKLQEDPFERIKNGTKTVEFRLYDEKRQTIQIGDEIEFSKLPELQEKLLVKVIDNPNLPIAKTEDIGHGSTSKCLIIGKNIILN